MNPRNVFLIIKYTNHVTVFFWIVTDTMVVISAPPNSHPVALVLWRVTSGVFVQAAVQLKTDNKESSAFGNFPREPQPSHKLPILSFPILQGYLMWEWHGSNYYGNGSRPSNFPCQREDPLDTCPIHLCKASCDWKRVDDSYWGH